MTVLPKIRVYLSDVTISYSQCRFDTVARIDVNGILE